MLKSATVQVIPVEREPPVRKPLEPSSVCVQLMQQEINVRLSWTVVETTTATTMEHAIRMSVEILCARALTVGKVLTASTTLTTVLELLVLSI